MRCTSELELQLVHWVCAFVLGIGQLFSRMDSYQQENKSSCCYTFFSTFSAVSFFFFLFGKRTCAKLCLTVVLIFFSDDQQNWESFYGYWSLAFSSSVNYLMFFAHTILG